MRPLGSLHPTELIPVPADTVIRTVLTAATGQAYDYPSGAQIMRLTGLSSAGGSYSFYLNALSTGAVSATTVDSSAQSSAASSGLNYMITSGQFFQIPGGSTGFSLVSPTSGCVTVEFWRK